MKDEGGNLKPESRTRRRNRQSPIAEGIGRLAICDYRRPQPKPKGSLWKIEVHPSRRQVNYAGPVEQVFRGTREQALNEAAAVAGNLRCKAGKVHIFSLDTVADIAKDGALIHERRLA
ncbi:MAG: hypothetical protein KJ579_02485 [Verrucomicrobia bacterium]|nr:hypothetical protein [Verrucomicrobiota bacterium]